MGSSPTGPSTTITIFYYAFERLQSIRNPCILYTIIGPKRSESQPAQVKLRGGERFAEQLTEIPYAVLRVESGTEVELPLTTLAKLLDEATAYHKTKLRINELGAEQEPRHDDFLELAEDYEGFRGVINKQDSVILTLVPQERDVTWDKDLLKEALGRLYPDVVRERYSLEIPDHIYKLDGKRVEAEQIVAVISKALVKSLGILPEEVELAFGLGGKIEVDEKRLQELEFEKRVILPEQARRVGKTVLAVYTDDLKPQKQAKN